MAKAAALFDITLHDHQIIGRGAADLCSKHLKTVLNPAFRQKGPSLLLGLEISEVAAGSTDRLSVANRVEPTVRCDEA
jgi:hypothetical protein